MRKLLGILPLLAALLLVPQKGTGQIISVADEHVNVDSVRRSFADQHYYFGLYKDNYFIFGCPVGYRPTRANSDVKFQVSVAQKLTRATLPFGTYLYLYYTQKVFWSVLENSMPMTDLNFNPGIGLAKPIFIKGRFLGKVTLTLEHESNGRDSIQSRSWNKVSFGGSVMVDPNLMVYGKFWIPIVDGQNNKDILKYCGIFQLGWDWRSTNRRLGASMNFVKRQGHLIRAFFNWNVTAEFSWRLSKTANQFLFVQYYNGYGEGLLDYNKWHSMLRVGIVIKPTLFSEF